MSKKNVVFVTGSSRGLGSVIIEYFARNGYDVVINYNNSFDNALELKKKIVSYGVNVLCLKGDITCEEDVINMASIIKSKFGTINCLVNNAGIALDNRLSDKSVNEFRKVLDTNLTSVFLVSKYISPLITYGSIINIASTDGIDTYYKEEMDYAASKAGVINLTKTLAKELGPNIRVNVVAPGWINTDMTKDLDSSFKSNEESKIILKRFGEPIEVAKVVYFLASEDASYINGSVIRVDGGY